MNVPFHLPWYDRGDELALVEALRGGKIVGDGPHTIRASGALKDYLKTRHALLTPSCTHALELSLKTLRIGPGDEVIVPSFTFVSTTNCVLLQGARIVFADIDPNTLTISPAEASRLITPRTRAIIAVGYAGVSPDMDALLDITRPRGIPIVEDAAQSFGATYKTRKQGTIGTLGCYSFHETKNLSTGEGGALVTSDDDLAARAEIIREKGTNRKQFLLGLVDKYTWVDQGSSYLPPDHTAALLLSQMAKAEQILQRRTDIHTRYQRELAPLQMAGDLHLPVIPSHSGSNYHLYHVLFPSEDLRNRAIVFCRERGVGTAFHYLPLHLSPMGRSMTGGKEGDFPVTESISARLLRLPIYPALTHEQQTHVIVTLFRFFGKEA